MKNIALIGSAGIPACYGGFEKFAQRLVENLEGKFHFIVFCSNKYFKKVARNKTWKGSDLLYISINSNGFSSILFDLICLLKSINKFNIIYLLGTSGAIFIPLFKIICKTPIITNIDGLEWKRKKWGILARLFLKISWNTALRFSNHIIADNPSVYKLIPKKYRYKCSVIAYGADFINKGTELTIGENFKFLLKDYYLMIARITPENNIELITDVFIQKPEFNLVIVGNWNSRYAKKIKQKTKKVSNILLLEAIYNQIELQKIAINCKAYIHGHSCGGTNPSLVEAMGLGIPIIAHNNIFNRDTTFDHAIFFKKAEDLVKILITTKPDDLKKMKTKLYNLAFANYRWEKIAEKYSEVFDEI